MQQKYLTNRQTSKINWELFIFGSIEDTWC